MPTGVALRDPRVQLFDAAERILLSQGANGLTSRAVTEEAGCAKGVLHRHFADFDAFLAELVDDRAARIAPQAEALLAAGQRTVADNLTDTLTALFGPVAVSIVALIVFRDDLRERLRRENPGRGIPILQEGTAMVNAYLRRERELGRIRAGADVDNLALMLIGGAHLIFAAARTTAPPARAEVHKVVTSALTAQTV